MYPRSAPARLLRQLSPQVWSVEAVVALSNLASCFAADEGLHHEALCLVFGDARLWLLTPADVQFEVHELLHAGDPLLVVVGDAHLRVVGAPRRLHNRRLAHRNRRVVARLDLQ